MPELHEAKVAILATHGYERSELQEPLTFLKEHGAEVEILAPEKGDIKSWDKDDWGDTVTVDKTVASANPNDYDALVLPGGQINPDLLRVDDDAISFIQEFAKTGKALAAICHAPWLLIEAGIAKGCDMTSYHSIKTDVMNAGAHWKDEPVVVHNAIITSRSPDDLKLFCAKIAEEIKEGPHNRNLQAAE